MTAGLEWRLTSDGERHLWWRVSYSIVVRSATTDYIGALTCYGLPQTHEGSEYLIRLVRGNMRQPLFYSGVGEPPGTLHADCDVSAELVVSSSHPCER